MLNKDKLFVIDIFIIGTGMDTVVDGAVTRYIRNVYLVRANKDYKKKHNLLEAA